MANEMKYCRKCGTRVSKDTKFCPNCGYQFLTAQKQTAMRVKYCKSCGKENTADAKFCRHCGNALDAPAQAQRANTKPQHTARDRTYTVQSSRQAVITPQGMAFAASTAAGEIDFGEIEIFGVTDAVSETSSKILSPFGGMFHGAGSYLGGVFRVFTKPASLIGVVLLAALWFVLAQFRDSGSGIVGILSWLTYSEGGFDRETIFGVIGGVLGKGTVAAALVSLLSGGLPKALKGIGALFTGHGEKRGIVSILFGILIGGAVYFAFAGKYASADTAMVGIAGAVLSLEALGGGSGKIYELAQSLTSRAVNGVRTAVRGNCDGFLTGLTLGFALVTTLSAAGVMEGLL